jgi:hypothetical protein
MLSRKLVLSDLGIVGPAFAVSKGLDVRSYLGRAVERRGPPPGTLTQWITDTLTTAQRFGFLKQQKGFRQGSARDLFELAHDSLDDIFRVFSLDFEKWISRRVYKFYASLYVLFLGVPIFLFLVMSKGLAEGIVIFLIGIFAMAIYSGIIYLFVLLFSFLARIILFPILRLLARGRVVLSTLTQQKPPSSNNST